MGEIAEMMLDGTLCEGCGMVLFDSPEGMPGYCSEKCARDRGADWWLEARKPPRRKKLRKKRVSCPVHGCQKLFKNERNMKDHLRDKHGLSGEPNE